MSLTDQRVTELETLCRRFRIDVIRTLYKRQTGHPGGSLSVCEILAVLYLQRMRVSAADPKAEDRDRLILSKGHAAPMLYRVLAEKGFLPLEELDTLRELDTRLQGHPCALHTPGVDATSGPLGLGLSVGIGMALGARLKESPFRTYVVLGDGEAEEGIVWEACMAAAKYRLDNLCAVLDWNRVQLDGTTDQIMPEGDLEEKFRAFGWHTIPCDGHDVRQLDGAFDEAERVKGRPSVILAHTIKGKGVSFMEGEHGWHGRAVDAESFQRAMEELGGMES